MKLLGYFPLIFEEIQLADETTSERFSGAFMVIADSILNAPPAKASASLARARLQAASVALRRSRFAMQAAAEVSQTLTRLG